LVSRVKGINGCISFFGISKIHAIVPKGTPYYKGKCFLMSTPLISIGVVLYKGEHYLPFSLKSLLEQSYTNFELILRDQSPNGEAEKYIRKNLPEVVKDPRVQLFTGENKWHSGGHNDCIARMKGEYYLCASYDMVYDPHFLQILVEEMEKPENNEFGSATGKLYRWDFECSRCPTGGHDPLLYQVLDSCGLKAFKNHHFVDMGQGEKDTGQYDGQREIFGASGALGFYRKRAIVVCINRLSKGHGSPDSYKNGNDGEEQKTGEFFDELLHYKNDIDLSYRLQWAGEKCLFIPGAHAWHDRQVGNKGNKKPLWVKASSFWGYFIILVKNVWGRKFSFATNISVLWYLFRAVLFLTLTAPFVFLEWKKIRGEWKKILLKRSAMVIKKTPAEMESLFYSSCRS